MFVVDAEVAENVVGVLGETARHLSKDNLEQDS